MLLNDLLLWKKKKKKSAERSVTVRAPVALSSSDPAGGRLQPTQGVTGGAVSGLIWKEKGVCLCACVWERKSQLTVRWRENFQLFRSRTRRGKTPPKFEDPHTESKFHRLAMTWRDVSWNSEAEPSWAAWFSFLYKKGRSPETWQKLWSYLFKNWHLITCTFCTKTKAINHHSSNIKLGSPTLMMFLWCYNGLSFFWLSYEYICINW